MQLLEICLTDAGGRTIMSGIPGELRISAYIHDMKPELLLKKVQGQGFMSYWIMENLCIPATDSELSEVVDPVMVKRK